MEKIRTLIVDDEPLAQEGIRLFLEKDAEIDLVGVCSDGREAVQAIEADPPDLLFLDVQMPEMDGFAVLSALTVNPMPVVVFVTAYDQHALRAFEVHALDYLLKPFTDDRFLTALQRAKQQIRQQKVHAASQRLVTLLNDIQEPISTPSPAHRPAHRPAAPSYLSRLVVKTGGRVFFVKAEEIDWIEAADYYVRLHVGGASHLLRETMRTLEQRLDPSQFQRIHRSTIVNLDRVASMDPYFHGKYIVRLHDGTQLQLTRRYRAQLEDALGRTL